MRLKDWLYRWYHGRKRPEIPASQKKVMAYAEEKFRDEPSSSRDPEPHWTARLVRMLIVFHQNHWKWIWSTFFVALSAFSGVYLAFKAC